MLVALFYESYLKQYLNSIENKRKRIEKITAYGSNEDVEDYVPA